MNKIRLILQIACICLAFYVLDQKGAPIFALLLQFGLFVVIGTKGRLFIYPGRTCPKEDYEISVTVLEKGAIAVILMGFLIWPLSQFVWLKALGIVFGYTLKREWILFVDELNIKLHSYHFGGLTEEQKIYTVQNVHLILGKTVDKEAVDALRKIVFEKKIWKSRNKYPDINPALLYFFLEESMRFWE